jgi:hypothetical protein
MKSAAHSVRMAGGTGAGEALSDYRTDHLLFLYLRGFGAPCQWTENEIRETMSVDDR